MSLIVNNLKIFLKHDKKQKEEQEKDEEKIQSIITCYNYGNKVHIMPNCPLVKKANQNKSKKPQCCMGNNYMESPNDEDLANIHLKETHQDDEVTSYFSYHDLFCICKKLTKETRKLERNFSTSKDTIYSLEFKNKNIEKEI